MKDRGIICRVVDLDNRLWYLLLKASTLEQFSFSNLSLMSLRFNFGSLCFAYNFPVTRVKYFARTSDIPRKFVFGAQNHRYISSWYPVGFLQTVDRKKERTGSPETLLRTLALDRVFLRFSSFLEILSLASPTSYIVQLLRRQTSSCFSAEHVQRFATVTITVGIHRKTHEKIQ